MQLFNENLVVSIVIPVYNGANYLKEAIESALAQTYKNIEIIVVNDGSIDETEEIAMSYGNKIRYFRKENGGVSSALNLGLREMKGEYFSWLSHDDVYYADKIQKQIEYLKSLKEEKVVLYSDFEVIDEKSEFVSRVHLNHKLLVSKPEYAILRGCINGITLLIPKKAFDEYGFFDENLKCTQDYDMWSRMAKTYKFMHTSEILAKYRVHSMQDTNRSPNVAVEGNALWIKLIKNTSLATMKKLEGSELNFYKEMVFFLRKTVNLEAAKFANDKANEILRKNNKSEVNFIEKYVFDIEEIINKVLFVIFSPRNFFKKYIK